MQAIALGVLFVLALLLLMIGMAVKLSSPGPMILCKRPDGLDRHATVAMRFIDATAC